jgi:hypothetical protein
MLYTRMKLTANRGDLNPSAITHPASRAVCGVFVERLFRLVAAGFLRTHAVCEGSAARGANRCGALFAWAGFGS